MSTEPEIQLPIQLPKCPWAKNDLITQLPRRVDLDLQIQARRKFNGYEEWKISFASEPETGLPDPSLARVGAYLLIPSDELFSPPYPGVVCFHQCGRDCDIGKDAVVGKTVERPDQAYGLELVQQGFVIIAPDSINCGERIISGLRSAGTPSNQWTHAHCWSNLGRYVPWGSDRWKKAWDGIRSVDCLRSLPFIDKDRIAVAGHSMGSGTALDTLIADSRVLAGILSPGGCTEEGRELAAPRLLIQQQGALDTTPDDLQNVEEAQNKCKKAYETFGASELVSYQVVPDGHHFSHAFKVNAYYLLKKHFGMVLAQDKIPLIDHIERTLSALEQREDLWWSWPNHRAGGKLPRISLSGDRHCCISSDAKRLARAFEELLIPLAQKIQPGSELQIGVDRDGNDIVITMSIDGYHEAIVAHESMLSRSIHHFRHCGARITCKTPEGKLRYSIQFSPKTAIEKFFQNSSTRNAVFEFNPRSEDDIST